MHEENSNSKVLKYKHEALECILAYYKFLCTVCSLLTFSLIPLFGSMGLMNWILANWLWMSKNSNSKVLKYTYEAIKWMHMSIYDNSTSSPFIGILLFKKNQWELANWCMGMRKIVTTKYLSTAKIH